MRNCTCGADSIPAFLREGLILDIYLTKDDGSVYKEGVGMLVRKVKDIGEPYPYSNECQIHSTDTHTINVIKESWVIVRTDDRFLRGQEFVRNFERFHSVGIISTASRYEDPDIDLIAEYCFSELDDNQDLCEDLRKEISGKKEKTRIYYDFIKYKKLFE